MYQSAQNAQIERVGIPNKAETQRTQRRREVRKEEVNFLLVPYYLFRNCPQAQAISANAGSAGRFPSLVHSQHRVAHEDPGDAYVVGVR